MRTGGAQRSSVLADVVEAIIGAVLLDGSHLDAQSLILRLYTDRIQTLPEPDELKDSKTRLQEWLQGRGEALPCYRVEQVSGKDHEKVFLVRCELDDERKSSVGKGRSRRRAEQVAAAALLADLIGEHGE
jgi:ribonuclease-3